MTYEAPQVNDYGELADLTAATGSGSVEDGGSKQFHPPGSQPTGGGG